MGRALERYDAFIHKGFYYVVILLSALSFFVFWLVYGDSPSLGYLLYSICCTFAAGFVVLGIPPFILRRTSTYPRWRPAAIVLVFSVIAGA